MDRGGSRVNPRDRPAGRAGLRRFAFTVHPLPGRSMQFLIGAGLLGAIMAVLALLSP
jgi:hypothetical protein